MRQFPRAGMAVAALLLCGGARAADLPPSSAPVYEPQRTLPLFAWTGFYVGLNAGVGLASTSSGSGQLFGAPGGFVGGGTLGYNMQLGPNFLIGVEGDIDGSTLGATNKLPFFGFNGGSKVSFLSTGRGRVGYVMDRALIYATGGIAFTSVSAYVNDWRAIPFFGSQSKMQVGFAVGAGFEYALSNTISARVEYLYINTASRDYFKSTIDASTFGVGISNIRAGVNYHF